MHTVGQTNKPAKESASALNAASHLLMMVIVYVASASVSLFVLLLIARSIGFLDNE